MSNTASGGVSILTLGMGLVSPSRTYVLYPLDGTSGQAVVQRFNPDGSLGALVWQSNWANALKPSGGSTAGEQPIGCADLMTWRARRRAVSPLMRSVRVYVNLVDGGTLARPVEHCAHSN